MHNDLTTFFMWCSIINSTLLVLWVVSFLTVPDLVYRTQSKFFPISRETFDIIFYAFLGFFKIIILEK